MGILKRVLLDERELAVVFVVARGEFLGSSQGVLGEFSGNSIKQQEYHFLDFLWIRLMYALNFGGRFLLFLTRSKSNSKSLQKGNLARLIELFDSGRSPHPVLKLYETKCYIVVLRGSIANFSTLKLNLV